MSLVSPWYAAWLVALGLLHWALPPRHRRAMLGLAGGVFAVLVGGWATVAALTGATLLAWAAGRLVTRATGRARNALAVAGVAGLVGLLAALRSRLGQPFAVVGASYFVVQAIGYVVDVQRDPSRTPASLGSLWSFLAFFPKLVQGPIERFGDLDEQLASPKAFDYAQARRGLLRMAVGFFKKVVIADRLAPYVDAVYGDVRGHGGGALWVATYLFALQIYFDFDGYTDVARGTASLFGVELRENFARPYLADRVTEFWRRWHRSFSTWLFEYVHRPVSVVLRHAGKPGIVVALLVTFTISGLWHGAALGFLVWGLLHGAWMALEFLESDLRRRFKVRPSKSAVARVARVALAFHVVCAAWVFFRASSVADAVYVLTHVRPSISPVLALARQAGAANFVVLAGALLATAAASAAGLHGDSALDALTRKPRAIRYACYYGLAMAVVLLGRWAEVHFVYEKF